MISVQLSGAKIVGGKLVNCPLDGEDKQKRAELRKKTITYGILNSHSKETKDQRLKIKFDALVSHDLTYVGIIQTARASGMERFPLPVALTCCHNSLCAVGGTINEDDHVFGLSAAKKYGGEFVPPHIAVIHQYTREMLATCGGMILGSDSHTRYGALGCMGFGEGGGELVKQLLSKTYDLSEPEVVAVWLEGKPRPGVGPHDLAVALVHEVFNDALVKNRVLEFVGPGVEALSVDFRLGVDVMTTETACLSSVWKTDEKVHQWLAAHGRGDAYKALSPEDGAWYDRVIRVDLSKLEPMIALPFHPGNAYPISVFNANTTDMLREIEKNAEKRMGPSAKAADLVSKVRNGRLYVDQAVVGGCSGGTFENLVRVDGILQGRSIGNDKFGLSLYPASQPLFEELIRIGVAGSLLKTGATMRSAFCGPCFGAGDVPCQNAFSIRHTTRNFPNREGSKPSDGQISFVALMDARSIAATALNGGRLTAATELDLPEEKPLEYQFDQSLYQRRVYHGWGHAKPEENLIKGPNIVDWPAMDALPKNLLLSVAAAVYDPVTTTDELLPSGETSSYRSNPPKMSEYTLGRRVPEYVGRAKTYQALERSRRESVLSDSPVEEGVARELAIVGQEKNAPDTGLGTVVFALRPGDGSAREQAASCQKVLGGWANIVGDYATKRYRSNLVNWGLLPFVIDDAAKSDIQVGDRVYIADIRKQLEAGQTDIKAVAIRDGKTKPIVLHLPGLTTDERDVILAGCLINYYKDIKA